MKRRQRNYLLGGLLTAVAGIFLFVKNSIGKYIDPWLSHGSRYKGHMSYWVAAAGIGMIIAGILMVVIAFSTDQKSPAGDN